MGKILIRVIILNLWLFNFYNTYSQTDYRFLINHIELPLDNKGILANVNVGGRESGRYDGKVFLYSAGFLISGKSGDIFWSNGMASASLIRDYQPGNVDSNSLDPKYKIYILRANEGDFAPSWNEWKNAVDLGAGFYDGDNDGIYNPVDLNNSGTWDPNEDRPDFLGSETVWCVYNDGVPAGNRRFMNVQPQGIEIHQTLFGYNEAGPLRNMIFIRYRLINTGKVVDEMDSVYFSAWADADIGEIQDAFLDDLVGSDIYNNSGYTYNDGFDNDWGVNPPAFFVSLLQRPYVFIPGETFIDNNFNGIYDEGIDTPLDTAYNRKGKFLGIEILPGAKNIRMSSFQHYIQSHPTHGDPINEFEARNYLMGLDREGNLVDPCLWSFGEVRGGVDCNEVNPRFMYSGDPVTDYGWINTSPDDQRQLVNTGPFKLKAGEPIDIFVAFVVGRGNDALSSVTTAKNYANYSRYFYNSNFGELPVGVEDDLYSRLVNYKLEQNYPNPFNPSTNILYQIPVNGFVTIKVYDLLGREVAILINEEKPAGSYEVVFDASSLSSGIYIYTLRVNGFVQTNKMILLK